MRFCFYRCITHLHNRIMKAFLAYAALLLAAVPVFAGNVLNKEKLHTTMIIYGGSSQLDFWCKIPPECKPLVCSLDHLYIGQKFSAFAMLSENNGDPSSRPDIEYSIVKKNPDGTEALMTTDDVKLQDGDGTLFCAPNTVCGSFYPCNAIGKYSFSVHAKDKATGETADSETPFELKEWSYPKGEAEVKSFEVYFCHFSPDDLFLMTFNKSIDLESWETTGEFNSSFVSFLKYAYLHHDFLLEKYRADFAGRSPLERKRILFLLAITRGKPLPDDVLTDDEKALWKKLEALHFHDPYESIESTDDLDSLWGEFFATGEYKPIRRLIDALAAPNLVASQFTKKLLKEKTAPKTDKECADFMRGIVYQTAVGSINASCRAYDLVAEYCFYASRYDSDIDPAAKLMVAQILAAKWPDRIKIGKAETQEKASAEAPTK